MRIGATLMVARLKETKCFAECVVRRDSIDRPMGGDRGQHAFFRERRFAHRENGFGESSTRHSGSGAPDIDARGDALPNRSSPWGVWCRSNRRMTPPSPIAEPTALAALREHLGVSKEALR